MQRHMAVLRSGVVATVCLAIGAVWAWLDLRQPAA
jgi:hypothetical protein